jgi:hypothetical protein
MHNSVIYIPHASKQLHETTISKSGTDDDVWVAETQSAKIDQAEQKRGKSETTETERSGIGELAALNGLIETGLEFTTKSWSKSVSNIIEIWDRCSPGRASAACLVPICASGPYPNRAACKAARLSSWLIWLVAFSISCSLCSPLATPSA